MNMASFSPNLTPDVENSTTVVEYLEGIAEFAAYIGSDRDLALFRRFDTLGARTLLYLQLELLALEEQLHEYDEEDKQFVKKNSTLSTDGKLQPEGLAWDVLRPAKDWKCFIRRATGTDTNIWNESQPADKSRPTKTEGNRQHRKMVIFMRIRDVLKEYRLLIYLNSVYKY